MVALFLIGIRQPEQPLSQHFSTLVRSFPLNPGMSRIRQAF